MGYSQNEYDMSSQVKEARAARQFFALRLRCSEARGPSDVDVLAQDSGSPIIPRARKPLPKQGPAKLWRTLV